MPERIAGIKRPGTFRAADAAFVIDRALCTRRGESKEFLLLRFKREGVGSGFVQRGNKGPTSGFRLRKTDCVNTLLHIAIREFL